MPHTPFFTELRLILAVVYTERLALIASIMFVSTDQDTWPRAYDTLWVHLGVAMMILEAAFVDQSVALDKSDIVLRVRSMEMAHYKFASCAFVVSNLTLLTMSVKDYLDMGKSGRLTQHVAFSSVVATTAILRLVWIYQSKATRLNAKGSPQTKSGVYLAPSSDPEGKVAGRCLYDPTIHSMAVMRCK